MTPLNPQRLRDRRRDNEFQQREIAARLARQARRQVVSMEFGQYLAVATSDAAPPDDPPKPSHWWCPLSWMWIAKT